MQKIENNYFDITNNKYIETPWVIIESYFKDQYLEKLVRHQLESYNNFVGYQIIKTIEMFNPVHIKSENDYDSKSGKYALEIFITFENFHIYRPQIHENNGAIKLMFPQEARLRNFTYASAMTIDINIKYIIRRGENLNETNILHKSLPKIHIGKLPIMLKSNICVLNQYKYVDNDNIGECRYDTGGYFIINGSEKTVLGQERAAENRIYCFNISKNNTKYTWTAEIKSIPDFKCISPKQINMFISSKNNGFGQPIVIQIPRTKQPIPLFIVFRALGVLSDKEICEYILLDINCEKYNIMLHNLQASIIEAQKHLTQNESIKYIMSNVIYTPINMDKETGAKKKLEFTYDVLENDLFPHCRTKQQKIYFLGYMANKLMQANFEWISADDRDSFLNKRIDLTGASMNNLFRNYFNKLVKDMEKQIIKEINNGSWRSTEDYTNIINLTNIYKIIKSTTIENGFKRALATGDFGIKHTNSNKVGVAQVLNRLTYIATLSHLRRISTPTDKSGKLIPPRKLHGSSWGFIDPAECFDPETQILMWDGTFKRAGDIKINDILIDDLGNATRVRTTCSGFKNMYDIIPNKNNFMKHRVTDNHILTLKIRSHKRILCSKRKYTHIVEYFDHTEINFKEKYFNSLKEAQDFANQLDNENTIDITIENYLKLNKRIRDRLVLFKIEGINWPKKNVEMDPYLLGMWLGDGLSDGTGFALNYKTDNETLSYWYEWAKNNGALIKKGKRYNYSVVSKNNCEAQKNGLCNRIEEAPLKKYLRKYNLLNNKHIPNEYITNNRETRLKLLAGLIDTDGSVRNNGHEIRICQGPVNYKIIEDAYILAMSLGFCCGITEGVSQWTDEKSNEKKFSTYKELRITGHQIHEIPTLLPRKKLLSLDEKHIIRSKSFMCSKFKLVEAGIGPYVGWQLDDIRGRFCLKDGLVTHNTPEGQSVGVVKSLSYMSHITIQSNSLSLHEYVKPFIIEIDDLKPIELFNKVKVLINGNIVGISNEPQQLYYTLKDMKYKGIINIYTSIVFDYRNQEIRLCNDAGRITRPLLRIKNNNILLNDNILEGLKNSTIIWDDLFTNCKTEESILEYIDPEEQSFSMIATKPNDIIELNKGNEIYKYTHCEIHPSTIFGIVSSCIPFPESNQSPRNTYQGAQAKQAMGIYMTNFNERMDKTAYVLTYPTRPLVDTRIMNLIKLNQFPSGCNINVAIMTHTGYNQEDSVLINKASIDRGLFQATLYHTEKDEDKQKINGDEEIRCKPDKNKTKGMKFGNYDKVNAKGLIPENTLVENRDIIIAKVVPIKENKNDHTKLIKYEDESRIYRTTEETYIDKNYIDRNGDGYTFAKVRLRTLRKPVIGDKFCLTDDHDVLTQNRGWVKISEVNKNDKVAQLNRQTNQIEYVNPLETMEFKHEGEMYEINNGIVSLYTTLNHRMWVRKEQNKVYGNNQIYKYELLEAKNILGINVSYQCGGAMLKTENIEYNRELELNINIYALLIVLSIKEDRNDYTYEEIYNISKNNRKIKKILEDENFVNKILETINVSNSLFALPDWMLSLSRLNSRLLLALLCMNNLSQIKAEEIEYEWLKFPDLHFNTTSILLRDQIQIISIHCGLVCITKQVENGEWSLFITEHIKYLYPQTYNVEKNVEKNIEKIDKTFDGKVYCIRVPSEVFLVRRNGCCVFTGNSSRHGQKGTVGNIIPEEDMPFTRDGDRPDIIINPHAIPSRMTIGQLKETILGKVLIELGLFGDGTSFGDLSVEEISKKLLDLGYEAHGNELLYNGLTGTQIECSVFMGPVFYQRLKHMVNDKQHSRSIGPMVNLTRQPAEGRSRDGGLRFGEMEKDAMVSHGASRFTRERMYDVSDKYKVHICKSCGMIASYNDEKHIHHCRTCDNRTDFAYVEIPYACKLMFQELATMNVVPRIITEN
jgi:DNA-directed RNA polymerase beta subunit